MHLVVPDRPASTPSGGDRYAAALLTHWPRLGREAAQVRVAGDWPWPTQAQVVALDARLEELGPGPALIDGLVGCATPASVRRSAALRPTALLVHSLLADGAGERGERAARLDRRERRALAAADLVVTVSEWAREELRRRHGVGEVVVARPGTERGPVAPGSWGPTGAAPRGCAEHPGAPLLLALGALTPLKNHAVLLAALEQVADLPWSAVLAGPAPDAAHRESLVAEAAARGIGERVRWPGTVEGEQLEELWRRTDLLLHPSRSETWAQVVAQAHAHGIPTVVGEGTGAVEALRGTGGELPGAAVPVEAPEALAAVLRRWLTGPALRQGWRQAALARRNLLQGWGRTVRQIDLALDRIDDDDDDDDGTH